MAKEVIIYVHGITPTPDPEIHKQNYDSFHDSLTKELTTLKKAKFDSRIDIYWGFNDPRIKTGDKKLAQVERQLYNEINEIAHKHDDFTLNPLRSVYDQVRQSIILGFADIFYYVSEDGKKEIRKNILDSVIGTLPALNKGEEYSLTIVAHSAGTIIMHDLLFNTFRRGDKNFLSNAKTVNPLREPAQKGKLTIRAFVTLGSPITPLIVRSQNLIDMIYENRKIDLSEIGIKDESKWLNFWDKDDIISYPVELLYENSKKLVEDIYFDVGDQFPKVHSAYWNSQRVIRTVAAKIR